MTIETCTAPGCDHPHLARGLCRRCYERAKRRERGLWVRVQLGAELLEKLKLKLGAGLPAEQILQVLREWAAR